MKILRAIGDSPCPRAARPIVTPPVRIYWHRDLPPVTARPVGDHTIEATSPRVCGTLEQRNELWNRCYRELMAEAAARLEQEIVRLGGRCAHVFGEHIEPRHDHRTGEAWMYGRFDYELYGPPTRPCSDTSITGHGER